ncbi:putative THOC5 family protein [Naviculisporaceae sp. PSN 640]
MPVDEHISDPSLRSVLEISNAAREQAVSLLNEISATLSGGAAPSPATLAELTKQQKILNTNLAQLRGLHRSANFRARETKGTTAEARHEVDVLHLQLQNLYYEQHHLEGEISACEGFEHSYQKLPLIPVEEFLSLHPEHARDAEAHKDEDDEAYENALMIARINHERAGREALEQQRLELQKRKQKLIAENKKRRDDLANLDKDLEKFIDAAKPIQKMFEKVA